MGAYVILCGVFFTTIVGSLNISKLEILQRKSRAMRLDMSVS